MMLRSIKNGLEHLDNRQFVDTVFSIGKLHKRQLPEEAEKPLYPFMNYLIGDLLREAKARILQLQDPMELAYLIKGITNL